MREKREEIRGGERKKREREREKERGERGGGEKERGERRGRERARRGGGFKNALLHFSPPPFRNYTLSSILNFLFLTLVLFSLRIGPFSLI